MASFIKFNQISRDTFFYIPVFLAPAIINIVLLMTFTRFFSPKEYGDYTIVVNTTIIISSLLAQWIVLAVQRFRAEYLNQGKSIDFNRNINKLLLYISIGFFIVATVLYMFCPPLLNKYQSYYWPSVLLIIGSIYFMVLGSIYQADLQAKAYRNLNVIQSALKLGIIFVMVLYVSFHPNSFIWGTLFAQALVTIPMLRYVETQKMFSGNFGKQSFLEFTRRFWTYGFPLIGWYIGTTIMNLTDRFMLEYYRSSFEVGVYSANFTISVQAIALICNPLFFAIQPIMMTEIQQNGEKKFIERRISNFTGLFIIIAMPFGAYFSIYQKEVSKLLLGAQFTSGAIIIPILIFGFFAWNIGLYGQLTYQIGKKTKEMFYFVVIAALCNFLLNLYFIPKWGFVGASISTTIGFIVYSGFLYFFSMKSIKWRIPWSLLIKMTFIVMILGIPTVLLKQHLFNNLSPLLNMIIGLPFFLVYLGLVWFFEKNDIKQMISK